MVILDGRKVKLEGFIKLKEKISKIDKKLGLTVIQIGENPASTTYVKQKEKMALELGFNFNHIKLDNNIKEDEILNIIDNLNKDNNVDGILVQMPIPSHINSSDVQNRIDPNKDVDGLTNVNMGKLFNNIDTLYPCTPSGIIELLKYYNIPLEGKNVVIVGRSILVGKPLAGLMTNNNATVTLCHSKTSNLKEITNKADILVSAIGEPNFITKDYVKEDAIIIDVGINRIDDKLVGDVNFDDVKEKSSYITPVPGGVGQMTILSLANNVYKAYMLRKDK